MTSSRLLDLIEHHWRVIVATALILLLWCVGSILRHWFVKLISGVMNVGLDEHKWPPQLN
jgi:hypothetical protein